MLCWEGELLDNTTVLSADGAVVVDSSGDELIAALGLFKEDSLVG